MALEEGFRADRLLGGHEVGDDRAQHLETTIIGATHAFTCLSVTLVSILRPSSAAIPHERLYGCGRSYCDSLQCDACTSGDDAEVRRPMIFKGVREGRPYPDHGLSHRQWAQIPPRQIRLDELVTTTTVLALDRLLSEDSTFYGDCSPTR